MPVGPIRVGDIISLDRRLDGPGGLLNHFPSLSGQHRLGLLDWLVTGFDPDDANLAVLSSVVYWAIGLTPTAKKEPLVLTPGPYAEQYWVKGQGDLVNPLPVTVFGWTGIVKDCGQLLVKRVVRAESQTWSEKILAQLTTSYGESVVEPWIGVNRQKSLTGYLDCVCDWVADQDQ